MFCSFGYSMGAYHSGSRHNKDSLYEYQGCCKNTATAACKRWTSCHFVVSLSAPMGSSSETNQNSTLRMRRWMTGIPPKKACNRDYFYKFPKSKFYHKKIAMGSVAKNFRLSWRVEMVKTGLYSLGSRSAVLLVRSSLL